MNKRFVALDAFRGLAAVAVVIFHINAVDSFSQWSFFRGSDILVQFFFVLSGFVLAHGYGFGREIKFKKFMVLRFFRLYPLHIFMLVVFILLEAFKFLAFKYADFEFNIAPFTEGSAFKEILPNFLLIQAWSDAFDTFSFNYPSWSISIEFYTYAIFFVSFYFSQRYKIVVWFCISLFAFVCIYTAHYWLVSAVLKGLSCFFGGALCYCLYRKSANKKFPFLLGSVIECILILGIILVVSNEFELRNIVGPLLFMVTVYAFSFESGAVSRFLLLDVFSLLAKLSYSIYMTHAAILFCFFSGLLIIQKLMGTKLSIMIDGVRYLSFKHELITDTVVMLIVLVVVYISKFTYRYIEKPGQLILKR